MKDGTNLGIQRQSAVGDIPRSRSCCGYAVRPADLGCMCFLPAVVLEFPCSPSPNAASVVYQLSFADLMGVKYEVGEQRGALFRPCPYLLWCFSLSGRFEMPPTSLSFWSEAAWRGHQRGRSCSPPGHFRPATPLDLGICVVASWSAGLLPPGPGQSDPMPPSLSQGCTQWTHSHHPPKTVPIARICRFWCRPCAAWWVKPSPSCALRGRKRRLHSSRRCGAALPRFAPLVANAKSGGQLPWLVQ